VDRPAQQRLRGGGEAKDAADDLNEVGPSFAGVEAQRRTAIRGPGYRAASEPRGTVTAVRRGPRGCESANRDRRPSQVPVGEEREDAGERAGFVARCEKKRGAPRRSVGRRFLPGDRRFDEEKSGEVVGVVGDVRCELDEPVPFAGLGALPMELVQKL